MKLHLMVGGALALALAMRPDAAWAQQTEAASQGVGDIIVTAQRRKAKRQEGNGRLTAMGKPGSIRARLEL
ncbi:hypothetical protein [Novosphingobium sp. KACC 22771]|uniref:hypothetical protein n=1 Tax=Novosphingobium sp. KACC 22771 TaxID=3025670 RepID=UPI0023671BA1|nr:hypothetical protein [Novosphingobium sp. KACC 22771]WDF75085.1 hypothetical protein PQ467_18890 [Novosphingobium sp. KACC 22771]